MVDRWHMPIWENSPVVKWYKNYGYILLGDNSPRVSFISEWCILSSLVWTNFCTTGSIGRYGIFLQAEGIGVYWAVPLLDDVSSMATGRQAPRGFSAAMQSYSTQYMHLSLPLLLCWHVSHKELIGTWSSWYLLQHEWWSPFVSNVLHQHQWN